MLNAKYVTFTKNGVETKIHYDTILDSEKMGKYVYPNAEGICRDALSLPIYPFLKMDEVDFVCERIREFNDIEKL